MQDSPTIEFERADLLRRNHRRAFGLGRRSTAGQQQLLNRKVLAGGFDPHDHSGAQLIGKSPSSSQQFLIGQHPRRRKSRRFQRLLEEGDPPIFRVANDQESRRRVYSETST
jgi:hypothetical protein